MQKGELEALKPHHVEFSTVDQFTHPAKGLYSFFQVSQAEDGVLVLFISYITLATPL